MDRYNLDINYMDEYGNTNLMRACSSGFKSMVKELLEDGANPNHQNNSGHTALMLASNNDYRNKEEMVALLLDNNANPNIRDNNGNTVLMQACISNQEFAYFNYHNRSNMENVIKLLLNNINNKVDLGIKNNNGDTALTLAHNMTIMKLLLDHIDKY